MTKKKPLKPVVGGLKRKSMKWSEKTAINAYVLRCTTDLSLPNIGKKVGISANTVTRWVITIHNDERLLAKALARIKTDKLKVVRHNPLPIPTGPRGPNGSSKKRKQPNGTQLKEMDRLLAENSYLKWCNIGLREGYIDRYLKEEK
jgi:transposase-like protein